VKKELSKKQLSLIMNVFLKRHQSDFKKKMSVKNQKELIENINRRYAAENFIVSFSKSGVLNYFIEIRMSFFGEFKEHFFHVTNCYCVDAKAVRRQFYKQIDKAAFLMKKEEKVKRMALTFSSEDEVSIKHFSKVGELTYVQLIGNTKKGLKALRLVSPAKSGFTFKQLEKRDMKKLIKLDRESHIQDKTSRMRKIFMKPDAEKGMLKFYNALLKNKSCIVAKHGNKFAGNIGYFFDKKNKIGLIASIFVASEFKGQGLSKLLYKKLLSEFTRKKYEFYLGASTTSAVLSTAKQLGRSAQVKVYLLKIT
jgi:predicted GNAT family acetyltransferase